MWLLPPEAAGPVGRTVDTGLWAPTVHGGRAAPRRNRRDDASGNPMPPFGGPVGSCQSSGRDSVRLNPSQNVGHISCKHIICAIYYPRFGGALGNGSPLTGRSAAAPLAPFPV